LFVIVIIIAKLSCGMLSAVTL